MPGHDIKGALREAPFHSVLDPDGTAVHELRAVERVGKRVIVECDCGNFFFAERGVAVCDRCGAEGDSHTLRGEVGAG